MAYKLTFKDKTVKLVTTTQGERVKQMQGTPSTKYVELDNNQYLLDDIKRLEYVAEEPTAPRLPEGPRCRSEHSIHKEIYTLYCKHRQTQPPHRSWQEFSTKAYDYLYIKRDKWCDYTKGTCYCKNNNAVKRVQALIGGEII